MVAAAALALNQSPVHAHPSADGMADAANNFLMTLAPEQKAKAVFELQSGERVNWHFVPQPRKGLPLGEMSPAQRHLAQVLLNSVLSHRGYFKALTIMSLEQILFDLENKAAHRNAELYYFSVFGSPGKDVWGWRVEGHHLSLNFLARGDEVLATTPSFLGTNPAEVRTGPRAGLCVLAQEEDLGRQLIKSLDAGQRSIAVLSNNAPRDVITGNARKVSPLEPAGLPAAKLDRAQRLLLEKLIKEFIGRNRAEVADVDWAKIEKSGWNKISFAWAGGMDPGQGHYYRVQGPTFLLEFDNTQNDANHVHAVWRDFANDFGEDVLRKHYEQIKHKN